MKDSRLRDNVYEAIEQLIAFSRTSEKKITTVTLNSAQFQIFKEYNEKDIDGEFHYRNVVVRRN